jgi:hypothetical protein
MTDELIPSEVRQFIIDNINSVAELEGLLLMSKNPETDWSVESLAQRLYTGEPQTEAVLRRLHALGFLVVKETNPLTCRYQPASQKLGEMVTGVAEIYAKYLVPVTNLIHSKPETKVQQFADAFKLRKKEDN